MQYKALIVDDSKLARMVMASAFRRLGPEWELIEATNADDAINVLAAHAVDIALIDFNMPGTDGLELVARISENSPQNARGGGVRKRPGRDYWPSQGT